MMAVAIPFAASVRVPAVPAPASLIVSDVIRMLIVPAAFWFTNVNTVPTGYATLALAGMVKFRAVVSAAG